MDIVQIIVQRLLYIPTSQAYKKHEMLEPG